MSDQTPEVEVEGTEDEVLDYAEMTEDALMERHTELTEQIAELSEQPKTLDNAQSINALRAERNAVVETVNSLRTLDEVPEVSVEDVALDATVSDDTDESPEADEADEATDEAPASEATDEAIDASTDAEVVDTPAEQEDTVSETDSDVMAAAEDAISEGEAHVAAADRPVAPATPERPRVAYVAGAGQSAYAQGTPMDNYDALAEAWESRRTSIRPGAEGGISRAVVASLPAFSEQFSDGDILSRNNSTVVNDRLIAEAVEAHEARVAGAEVPAHVAAICDPLDIIRDIPEDGDNSSPFSDLFPSRPASRLGFTYTPASALSVAASGVNVWEEADQDGVDEADPSTWKPVVHIECSTPVEVKAKELVTGVTVDNSTEMSSPERVREFMAKLATARARAREQHLLGLYDAEADAYTKAAVNTEGTLLTAIRAVVELLPTLTYGERLSEQAYTAVVEPGFVQKLRLDNLAVGEKESFADAVATFEAETGIRLVALKDFAGASTLTTTAPGAVAALNADDVIRLVPTSQYIYSATGEQSTGWQTDPQLARQNRMQAFSAEWLLLAKHGVAPAAKVTVTSVASGIRKATA